MLLISHRGNIDGPNPKRENHPDYIMEAVNQGYDVEIDVWKINDEYFLGHDEPQYKVERKWLALDIVHKLENNTVRYAGWFHCKNIEALIEFKDYNSFGHDNDDYVLTGNNYIWAYPGKEKEGCICVMPELNNRKIPKGLVGICSDYIQKYSS